MKSKTYESDPLPVSLPVKKYYDGVNNQVFIVEKTKILWIFLQLSTG